MLTCMRLYIHRGRDAQRKNMASTAQWSCPGTSPTARWHKQSLGSDPLSERSMIMMLLSTTQPDRITMAGNSAFKRFIQICASIQHLQGSPLCLAIRIYSRWKEKQKYQKKERKTKCFYKLKLCIDDTYIARSIPCELGLKGCKLLCFITWGA